MIRRSLVVLLMLAILVAIPLLLRPAGEKFSYGPEADKLVIVTPNTEMIKYEFRNAFRKHYQKKYGKDVNVEYRNVGGTSDIVRYINDRFVGEFRRYYLDKKPGEDFDTEIEGAFRNYYLDQPKALPGRALEARKLFLASDIGIDIDLFWGGGTYDQGKVAAAGLAVDGKVRERHPEYFSDEVIPESFGGELFFAPNGGYYGVCLSSFGICYNKERVGDNPPLRWNDLGDPRFLNAIAVSDPTKSGSVTKCFEMMFQQAMYDAGADKNPEKLTQGWADGFNLIKRIVANSRYLTDSAGRIPRDVAKGDAAAGMCIDFYGLSEAEFDTAQSGREIIVYQMPLGGSAITADPIQLLRGAPNRVVAERFIDFLLSREGQQLWNYRPGTPGGPEKYALRRIPIRRDLYSEKDQQYMSDPNYNPYQREDVLVYNGRWTGRYFNLMRVLIKELVMEPDQELKEAYRELVKNNFPPEATLEFNKILIPFDEAAAAAKKLSVSDGWSVNDIVKMRRQWVTQAQEQYRRARDLARAGR